MKTERDMGTKTSKEKDIDSDRPSTNQNNSRKLSSIMYIPDIRATATLCIA